MINWLQVPVTIAAGLFGVSAIVDRVWDRVARDPARRNDLKALVAKAVDQWRKDHSEGGERLLVVFVDDLDRCSPQAVLGLLEAMKVYLDVPGLVFVVGYDQHIVSRAVLESKGYDSTTGARDYLEKFIQMMFVIPRPSNEQASALIDDLLDRSGIARLLGEPERKLV